MTTQYDVERALFDELKAKYSNLLTEFKTDDLYINSEFETAGIIPDDTSDDGLQLTKPSTVYDAVENAANHILSFPRITVPVRAVVKDQETAITIARKKQRFLELWWDRVFVDQGDPLGMAKKQLIKGKCVLKKEIDWRLLPSLDYKDDEGKPRDPTPDEKRAFRSMLQKIARSKFLWRLRCIPKETVFEDIENPHDSPYVFEAYSCAVGTARRNWPHIAHRLTNRTPLERVEYIEYWLKPGVDPKYPEGRFIQWIDDERVHENINPYSWTTPLHSEKEPDYDGYVPYAIGDPGWGDIGPETKPEDRYMSLVRPMRSMALADCRLLTAMEAYLRLYIWKPMLTAGYGDDAEFRLGPAARWERDEANGQSIDLLQFGEMPVSLLQGMARVREYMDEHSKFGTLGGSAQRGVDTATEASQNVQLASSMLSSPVRTLRRIAMTINSWVLMDIEHVLEAPVTIYGATRVGESEVTLTPKEIGGFYATNVEMETSDEAQLSLRIARVFADLYQRLPISAEGVLEKAGYADPPGEMDRRLLEDIERTPQSMQVFTIAMLTGLAETVSEAKLVAQAFTNALAQLQGGKAAPGAMTAQPDMPANPVEDLRTEARDSAIADQPELSMS